MSRRDGMHVEGLDSWKRWLISLRRHEVDQMKDRILRTAGLRALEYVHDFTPVRMGRLAGSMSVGAKDNVFEIKVGRDSYVFVGTAVPYARWVNDGFQQKKGQFVPGYWKSGHFHYDPKAEGGMVLTGKLVPGAHMFDKAMDNMRQDMPKIMEFEFRRLYQQLFG